MHLIARTVAALVLATALSSAAVAQTEGRLHGVVADESGGVLPGVTVTATAADGTVLAAGVTNDVGRYEFALPAMFVTLTFSLEGFSTATVDLEIAPRADVAVAAQRLALASRSETVDVLGDPPAEAPAAPAWVPPPPPPPPPVVIPVPEHDRDSVCGPAKADAAPESLGTILSRSNRFEHDNALFAKDDQVAIDGGTLGGLTVGLNVVARRSYRPSPDTRSPIGEHTAGLLQIVRANERESLAVVIYACDEIMRGDRLAPFTPEPLRAPEPAGAPTFDEAAQILFADSGQLLGAPRRFMVIDRGADQAIRAGQRLTLFRREARGDRKPIVVGDAVVVAVRHDSATIRVERVNDAIGFGDWAAPQRRPESAAGARQD